VLSLPVAQSEARPLKSSPTKAATTTLPFAGSDVTDFSARRRYRQVSRHQVSRHHVRHVSTKQSHGKYASHSRRARTATVAIAPAGYASADLSDAGYRFNAGAWYAAQQAAPSTRGRRARTAPVSTSFGLSNVVDEARRYLGGNPTGMSRAWCAAFMNMVLRRTGHTGTGSNLARSFASYGRRVSGPQVGAIAVMSRRGGGHVGVVSGIDAKGNPIVISGNHGRRVAESVYSRGRIYAYVMP